MPAKTKNRSDNRFFTVSLSKINRFAHEFFKEFAWIVSGNPFLRYYF